MPGRRGVTLIEVILATGLLVLIVSVAIRTDVAARTTATRVMRWRRTADEVADLLRRFERAPCAPPHTAGLSLIAGEITFAWSVSADSGRLIARAWPADAPLVVRRGLLRSVLPCP